MEYSKEDLMEAKRQILGVGENMGTEESKKIWEKNAQFWDDAMGDESNEFHREVVRPKVTELLSPDPSDYILDIACGNGNYSLEMSRNVQSGNTQNLKSMVIQRSFPKWSVAERRKTAAASDQAAVCACAHSRYFAGGSPSGLRV